MTPYERILLLERKIKDIDKKFCCLTPNNLSDIVEYADNDAALLAGLVVGDIYRTGDDLKIVH